MTEEMLSEVLYCPKQIVSADRKRPVSENRHRKVKLYLKSFDDKYEYFMYLRQSLEFFEDFSVGLFWSNASRYSAITKDILLARFQGPHDGKEPVGFDIHHDFHTHMISLEDIEQKRYDKPSNRKVTDAFGTYEKAALCFVRQFCISGAERYPDIIPILYDGQLTLY